MPRRRSRRCREQAAISRANTLGEMVPRWRVGDLIFPGRNGTKLVYTFVTALNKASVATSSARPSATDPQAYGS
jgi:hypothetical protein